MSEEYDILKFKGKSAWGVTLFDEANPKADRRASRTARRRLNRRQQRVGLVKELFAEEIAKKDEDFYKRLQCSALWREDTEYRYPVFNDENYTDKEYYDDYPTIHHLIAELMQSDEPHDVRLVYIACAWLVAHRGHFLNNIEKSNIEKIKDFDNVYSEFEEYFIGSELDMPWAETNTEELGNILKKKIGVTAKEKELKALLYGGKNPSNEATEEFPFNRQAIVKLLAGGQVELKKIFLNDEYAQLGSISLRMDDDALREKTADIGDDFELIEALRGLADWAVLADVLGEAASISEAKVAVYKQHEEDLVFLKGFIKKYIPEKYNEIFRNIETATNYPHYVHHTDEATKELKSASKEDFSKYILKIVSGVTPDDDEREKYDDMISRLELRTFLPKQKDTDNRVIPHQLYWYELNCILKKASGYLPFLAEKDEDGLSVAEKIESVFLFRIPYFVGPLNKKSPYAWLERKAEKISFPLGMRPWKVNTMLSLDGFRVCISGSAGKGKCLIVKPFMPFSASGDWCFYLKKLEELSKKADKNASYVYSEKYDKVSAEKNIELYDLYIEKLTNTIYSKRPNPPVQTLISGRERFLKLDIISQTKALLNIHLVFGRIAAGIDLTQIGGKSIEATSKLSTKISNWKKNYTDVRIVDTSPSGLREKKSVNLLELL